VGLKELVRKLERLEATLRPKSGECCCKPQAVAVVDTRPEDERFGLGVSNDDPDEPCPRCGGKKYVIRIVYTDDWRGVRGNQ